MARTGMPRVMRPAGGYAVHLPVAVGAILLVSCASAGVPEPTPRGVPPPPAVVAAADRGDRAAAGVPDDLVSVIGSNRLRHGGQVTSLDFSPDGRLLASGSDDRTVCIWEVGAWRKLATLRGHEDRVLSVTFSPDGRTLASTSWDYTLRLWDVATGRQTRLLDGCMFAAFSDDGKTLIVGDEGRARSVRVLDYPSGEERLRLVTGAAGYRWEAALSADGRRVAAASPDGGLTVWDARSGHVVTRVGPAKAGLVRGAAFSPDGSLVATASGAWSSDIVRVLDAETGDLVRVLEDSNRSISFLRFFPDGRRLLGWPGAECVSDTWFAHVWNTSTGEKEFRLLTSPGAVDSAAISPDGRWIATGANDLTIRIWDAETGRDVTPGDGHHGSAPTLAFSPDGMTLASGGGPSRSGSIYGESDDTIRLWDIPTGCEIARIEQGGIPGYTPDARYLLVYVDSTRVLPWFLDDEEAIREAPGRRGPARWLDALSGRPSAPWGPGGAWPISPGPSADGPTMALRIVGPEGEAGEGDPDIVIEDDEAAVEGVILDLATGEERLRFPVKEYDSLISVHGGRLAFLGPEGTIYRWDARDGGEPRPLDGSLGDQAFFGPTGDLLTVEAAEKGAVALTEVETGETRLRTDRHRGKLLLSPGHEYLAGREEPSGKAPDHITVWDLAEGEVVGRIGPVDPSTVIIGFSPDGETLVGGWGSRFSEEDFKGVLTFDDDDDDEEDDREASAQPLAMREPPPARVHLWAVKTGREVLRLEGARSPDFRTPWIFSPDSSKLAVSMGGREVGVYDTGTGDLIAEMAAPDAHVARLEFSTEGAVLGCSLANTVIIVWDYMREGAGEAQEGPTGDAVPLTDLWEDLGGTDPRSVRRAFRALLRRGDEAVEFLGPLLLKRPSDVPPRALERIAEMGSGALAARARAKEELRSMGTAAEEALRAALEGEKSWKVRSEALELIEELTRPHVPRPGEEARVWRGIRVLEARGTTAARRYLVRLASGTQADLRDREAQRALDRLNDRKP